MDDILKATRTQRVSVEGTKRGQNPSSNLGLVNTFGGSAFKPPKPVRKDMDDLAKAVNDLRGLLDKGSAVMSALGHQQKQPGTKPVPGGERAFTPQKVKKAEPVTKADMDELSKGLKGLKGVVQKALTELPSRAAPRAVPPAGKFDSMGRNYKKPEPKKKEQPTW